MMIPFLALLAVHWFADFVLQTHWQASNKSKRLDALVGHVFVYTSVLGLASFFLFAADAISATYKLWFWFVLLNGALHFATDYFTSRISSRFYAKQDWHNFFVVIGFDQLFHQLALAWTMLLFFGGGHA